jgi:hypothetical protein
MRGAVAVWLAVGCAGGGDDGGAPSADVVGVRATGDAGAYTFWVSIASDETGCDRYADWWEVLDPAGNLVFRRILDHSHPDEQPFERDGGPVPVAAADEVLVRAHLHPGGYVGDGMRGSVAAGFTAWHAEEGFAAALASAEPQPASCLF